MRKILSSRNRAISIHMHLHSRKRQCGRAMQDLSLLRGIKDRTVQGTDKCMRLRMISDGHALMSAGALIGNEATIRQAYQEATIAIGRIAEGRGAIYALARLANHRTRVRLRFGSFCRGRGGCLLPITCRALYGTLLYSRLRVGSEKMPPSQDMRQTYAPTTNYASGDDPCGKHSYCAATTLERRSTLALFILLF